MKRYGGKGQLDTSSPKRIDFHKVLYEARLFYEMGEPCTVENLLMITSERERSRYPKEELKRLERNLVKYQDKDWRESSNIVTEEVGGVIKQRRVI